MGTDEILARSLIDIAILLAVSQLLRLIMVPLHQPDVLAYVLAGFVVGPSLLGSLPFDPSGFLFPGSVRSGLSVISSLGLVVFAFAIGLGLDLREMRRRSRSVVGISIGALAAPLIAGAALALVLYPAHREVGGAEVPRLAFVLFLATAMAVTAFPVLVVHARDDHHVPIDFAIAAAGRHRDWTIEILERGGHHAHVTEPGLWLEAVEPFRARLG